MLWKSNINLFSLYIFTRETVFMENDVLHITFLGTGTSQGVPVIGCSCAICTSKNPKNARLRTSLLLSYNKKNIVIDAGPDFRQHMLTHVVTHLDAILLTHEHKDHVAGLDDIRPFNFMRQKAMDIFAERRVIQALHQEFSYVFKDDPYPGVPLMNLHEISESPFYFESIHIEPIRVYHWKLPIIGFRIYSCAYITDASEIPEQSLAKLANLEVLIINALRIKPHYSHFNLEQALHIIAKVKPKRAYLTHISHLLGDFDEIQKILPKNTYLAYDGLTIEIPK